MRLQRLNRWQVATSHLGLSLVIGMGLFLVFRLLWYPGAFWDLSRAGKLLLVLLGVDITLGPLLTLIVLTPNKPLRLKLLDLGCIAMVQLAALTYGLFVMATSRPVFLVAAVDRFKIVSAKDIDPSELARGARPEYQRLSWTGPVLVGASTPDTLRGQEKFDFIISTIRGGDDIEELPRFYTPFEESRDDLLKRARTVDDEQFRKMDAYAEFKRQFDAAGLDPGSTRFVLLEGRAGFGVMAIDAKTAKPLQGFAVDLY